MKERTLLITGAAGYIGSHVVEHLIRDAKNLNLGQLILVDDLSSGHLDFIDELKIIALKYQFPAPLFFQCSLLDLPALQNIFAEHRPEAVFHLAAKISVAESVEKPELYFRNNVEGSRNLLLAMRSSKTKKIIFSSTAAVYGRVESPNLAAKPLLESTLLAPINPYGESKLKIEEAITRASQEWGLSSIIFRYFNASGASQDSNLGEWHEPETHLIPLVLRAIDAGEKLKVFGTDYETRDGTCIRDYIHVSDLASAHQIALKYLDQKEEAFSRIFNLGTAAGTSVLEVIKAAEKVSGRKVPFEIHPRRAGDSDLLVADASLARKELVWEPKHSTIENIIQTAFHWEKQLKRK